jgi:transcriptional regulator of heat shock response
MKVKTSHLIWGSLALLALSQGENVRSTLAKGNQIRQEQAEFSDRIRANRTEAKNAKKLSLVALDRYRLNCILVVDQGTGKESYFRPGTSVIDKQLGRVVRSGVPICNRLGDTAIVSEAGTVTDIARVAVPDIPKFQQLLHQRKR